VFSRERPEESLEGSNKKFLALVPPDGFQDPAHQQTTAFEGAFVHFLQSYSVFAYSDALRASENVQISLPPARVGYACTAGVVSRVTLPTCVTSAASSDSCGAASFIRRDRCGFSRGRVELDRATNTWRFTASLLRIVRHFSSRRRHSRPRRRTFAASSAHYAPPVFSPAAWSAGES
jgi:hypothetical protein